VLRTPQVRQYIPAGFLLLGCLSLLRIDRQAPTPLPRPLALLPADIEGYHGQDHVLAAAQEQDAGVSAYLLRTFSRLDTLPVFSIYVGYYDIQGQGKTIHSPKNCLPGAGWEPVDGGQEQLETPLGLVPINRYLLANRDQKAVVLYWYQGRGRVAANEYRVKLELLRDAALRGRTEEALVRVVVPVTDSLAEGDADRLARSVARRLVPALQVLLPS
jgi:EpsI family protein